MTTSLGTPGTAAQLGRYRERHRIEPHSAIDERYGITTTYCRHCGLRVYPVRRGWRHDAAEAYALGRLVAGF